MANLGNRFERASSARFDNWNNGYGAHGSLDQPIELSVAFEQTKKRWWPFCSLEPEGLVGVLRYLVGCNGGSWRNHLRISYGTWSSGNVRGLCRGLASR